ncbi:MAG: glycosyltransferase family 2 protein [Nitrososphaeria archaeon]
MGSKGNIPKVSIIILNWNGRKYIRECLTSLLNTIYPKDKLEIIVVDNASTDGSDKIVAQEFPEIILIKNQKNLGFCEGNNIGISCSTGDVIVLLNNDCFVDPNWLIEVINAMNAPNVGIVGCKLVNPHSTIIQSCGAREIFLGYWEHIAAGLDIKEFKCRGLFEVDYVSGAAIAMKRQVLEKIGLLDPIFWAYVEDVDFCYRAKKAGFKIFVAPRAIVYHYGSMSWKKMTIKQFLLNYKNKILFIYKNYPGGFLLKYLISYLPKFTLRALINFLHKETTTQRLAITIRGQKKLTKDVFIKKLMKIYLTHLVFFFIGSIYGLYHIILIKKRF